MTGSTRYIQMRLILTLMASIMLVTFPFPAFAVDDSANVTVTISEIYEIEYTGGPVIKFDIGYIQLEEGFWAIVNHGDIKWWANGYPWKITIERTLWDTDDGDEDLEFWLRVKSGPPINGDWTTVPVCTDPDDVPADWIFSKDLGLKSGTGTIYGIDWKIKKLT